jgi:heme-degrading monooxygenase HmoA
MWHGWTNTSQADTYENYLKNELFPQVERDLGAKGYRGFHVLRTNAASKQRGSETKSSEVKFVTLVWFDSLDAVRAFAGEKYEVPVISPKAHTLLTHYAERVEHFEVAASSWSAFRQT